MKLFAIFSFIGLALGAPNLFPFNPVCLQPCFNAINNFYGVQATSFCSSYLGYPRTATSTIKTTKTATSTKQTTLPNPTQTTSLIVTILTTQTVPTSVQLSNVISTAFATTTVTVVVPARKLRARGLEAFLASEISTACSCIVTPTTQTVLQTSTLTLLTSITATNGPTKTIVVAGTTTVIITSSVATTITLAPTGTDTFIATTTVVVPAVPVVSPYLVVDTPGSSRNGQYVWVSPLDGTGPSEDAYAYTLLGGRATAAYIVFGADGTLSSGGYVACQLPGWSGYIFWFDPVTTAANNCAVLICSSTAGYLACSVNGFNSFSANSYSELAIAGTGGGLTLKFVP